MNNYEYFPITDNFLEECHEINQDNVPEVGSRSLEGLTNSIEKQEKYKYLVLNKGNSLIDEDRRAEDEIKKNNPINIDLLTATLLYDGGYYKKALEKLISIDSSFSIKLDDWKVTNQKSSGRCWLFATLNLFRPGTMKKLNVKNFEFSQSHIHFWDKFERSNHFFATLRYVYNCM